MNPKAVKRRVEERITVWSVNIEDPDIKSAMGEITYEKEKQNIKDSAPGDI